MKTIHPYRNSARHWLSLIALGLVSLWQTAVAEEALRILQENCMRCHGAEKRKGGLALHTRLALMKGGETGDVVNLEEPAKSSLIELLQPEADPHMPPKKQLSEEEVAAITDWIKAGANWDEKTLRKLPPPRELKWRSLPSNYGPIGALQVSPDGKQIALGRGSSLQVMNLSGKEPVVSAELKASRDVMQSVAWHPDGKRVVTGDFAGWSFGMRPTAKS